MNDIYYLRELDNSRISRPVDLRMNLQLGSWLLVALFLLGALLLQAWESVQLREMGYRIESLRSETDAVQQANHLLQVERAALSSPQRIDSIARDTLGMMIPSQQQLIMLDSTHLVGDQPVMAQIQPADRPMPPKRHLPE